LRRTLHAIRTPANANASKTGSTTAVAATLLLVVAVKLLKKILRGKNSIVKVASITPFEPP
jgi:hypothetical protein